MNTSPEYTEANWAKMHPVDQMVALNDMVIFFGYYDREGLSTVSVVCELNEWGKKEAERARRDYYFSTDIQIWDGNVRIAGAAGLRDTSLVDLHDWPALTGTRLGFPVKREELMVSLPRSLSNRFQQRIKVGDEFYDDSIPDLQCAILPFSIDGQDLEISLSSLSSGFVDPVITANLTPSQPLENQIGNFVGAADCLLEVIAQLDQSANVRLDPDASTKIKRGLQAKIDENIKSLEQTSLSEYPKRLAALKQILSHEAIPYEQRVESLERERQILLDQEDAEPQFKGVVFPFERMARYDFSCQAYLSDYNSGRNTMALHRVLDDLGITLDERVVKLHYVNLAVHKDHTGNNSYELLTANPRRVARWSKGNWRTEIMSIGSTHNDIRDTYDARETEGADYGDYDIDLLLRRTSADKRGVVFQTDSGKLYAIWGLDQPYLLRSGAAGLQEVEKAEGLDSGLLEDFSRRYGITVVSGKHAASLLEKIIFEEFTNLGAIAMVKKSGQPLTNTNWLRSRLLIRAGLPFGEED